MKSAVWTLIGLSLCAEPAFSHPNHDTATSVPCTLHGAEARALEGACRLYEAPPYVVVGIDFDREGEIAAVSGAINLDLAHGALSTGSGETLAEGPMTIEGGPEGVFGAGALWTWDKMHLEFLPEHVSASRDIGTRSDEWPMLLHMTVVLAVVGAVLIGHVLVFGRGAFIDDEVRSKQ